MIQTDLFNFSLKSVLILLAALFYGISCVAQPNQSYENLLDEKIISNWLTNVLSDDSLVFNANYTKTFGVKTVADVQEVTQPGVFPTSDSKAAVILVTHDTYCGFCIAELDFWNNLYSNNDTGILNEIDLLMVVVDSESNNFNNFLTRNRYILPSVLDRNRLIEDIVERFYVPFKLLILPDGTIADVSQIGGQNDIYRYLNFVQRQIQN
jgi:hypothetical protein